MQVRYYACTDRQWQGDRWSLFTIEYHRLFCYPLTNCKPINSPPSSCSLSFLNLLLVADAYCLLNVYSVLSSNPACFGLPADLRSISSSQSEKSGEKKQKEKQAKQTKQAHGKEVRSQLPFPQQLLLFIVWSYFDEVAMDTKCFEV